MIYHDIQYTLDPDKIDDFEEVDDPDAQENLAHSSQSARILVEDRSYFYRVGEKGDEK